METEIILKVGLWVGGFLVGLGLGGKFGEQVGYDKRRKEEKKD
jgi:hypothetical protein